MRSPCVCCRDLKGAATLAAAILVTGLLSACAGDSGCCASDGCCKGDDACCKAGDQAKSAPDHDKDAGATTPAAPQK